MVVPIVLLGGTLFAVGTFARTKQNAHTVRYMVEWQLVGSYAWLAVFYVGGAI